MSANETEVLYRKGNVMMGNSHQLLGGTKRAYALPSRSVRRLSLTSGARCWLYLILGVALLVWVSATATAETILNVPDVVVSEGQSGVLDLWFDVQDETPMLACYMIELKLVDRGTGDPPPVPPDDPKVLFVYEDPQEKKLGEAPNAVFPGQRPIQTAVRLGLPGVIMAANDLLLSGEKPISDGARLLRIPFETFPGSVGVYDVLIDTAELRTNFYDGLPQPVLIDAFNNGLITVVPEPGTLVLLATGGVFLLAYARRKRRWR